MPPAPVRRSPRTSTDRPPNTSSPPWVPPDPRPGWPGPCARTTPRCRCRCGILAGPTGGAAYFGAVRYLRTVDDELDAAAVAGQPFRRHGAVFIVCDRIESYLSYVRDRRPDLLNRPDHAHSVRTVTDAEAAGATTMDVAAARLWMEAAGPLVIDLRGPFAYATPILRLDQHHRRSVRRAAARWPAVPGSATDTARLPDGGTVPSIRGPAHQDGSPGRPQPRRRNRRVAGHRCPTGEAMTMTALADHTTTEWAKIPELWGIFVRFLPIWCGGISGVRPMLEGLGRQRVRL
jgi:hypothetical protein